MTILCQILKENEIMIHSFKVQNFYSIGSEQVLDFTTNKKNNNAVAENSFGYINKLNCFMGNNASGKTNILKAMVFFKWLAEDTFSGLKIGEDILFKPHILLKDEPTKMEMVFSKEKNLFKLEFVFNQKTILNERLSYKNLKMSKFRTLYTVNREGSNFDTRYFEPMKPLNINERRRLSEKSNSSMFSYMTTTGALSSLGLNNIFGIFLTNLVEAGAVDAPSCFDCTEVSSLMDNNPEFKKLVLDTVKTFDVGITDISKDEKMKFILSDKYGNKVVEEKLINFIHGEGKNKFTVPLPYESQGTIKAISLLYPFYELIKNGGTFIIDEIEMSKHPDIIKKLLSSFEFATRDRNDIQIIFSTHQHILLEDRSKSQIFLTEKGDSICTEVYRLDDIEGVRNDENFALKYLTGRYGAVPRMEVKIGE